MSEALLPKNGARPPQEPQYTAIHVSRALRGLVTNRSALHDPSTYIVERFYGGAPDALFDGNNIEVSPQNTWKRRYGTSAFGSVTYPTPPLDTFAFHNADGSISLFVDTATAVYLHQGSTKTLVFTKSAGAGQTSFLQLGTVLYFANGVDAKKYINGTVYNWGITGPVNAPSMNVIQSGAAAVQWSNLTTFTTMGLLDDGVSIQQLISVNADGSNANGTIGTSSSGGPAWSHTPGGTTTDTTGGGTITWTNFGPIVAWTPNTLYNNSSVASGGGTLANPCIIYDPVSKSCYTNANPSNAQGTSGSVKPPFNGGFGSYFHDGGTIVVGVTVGGVKWFCIGNPKAAALWQPSHSYPKAGTVSNNNSASSIAEPTTPDAAGIGGPNPQQIFWQVNATGNGTSGTGGASPKWATSSGTTDDGQLRWAYVGPRGWQASHAYTAWIGQNAPFSAIIDSNGNFQVAINQNGTSSTITPGTVDTLSAAANASAGNTAYTGTFSPTIPANATVAVAGFVTAANNGTFTVVSCTSTVLTLANPSGVAETHAGTATVNPWGTIYGQNTTDNTVTWTCVGQSLTWTTATKWYLPLVGFNPPTSTDPYGGADVNDSNNNVEFVVNSGKSGASAPTWLAQGAQTSDGTITWFNNGPAATNSLAFTKGYGYCYALKARAANDFFVTNIPNGKTSVNGPPTGSATGGISTASPVVKMATGSNSGAVITVSGVGSLDPQVDTIVIFRSVDGSQGGPYLELTEFPAPAPVNGNPGTWNFQDYITDTNLNTLVQADVTGLNDPPPTGFANIEFHGGRVWGSVGNIVYSSANGSILPDNGNGNESFPGANSYPVNSPIVRLLQDGQGLLVFTQSDLWQMQGGPAATQYFPVKVRPGVGLANYNSLIKLGGEIIIFTADVRLLAFMPGAGEVTLGWDIGDKLQALTPANVYMTLHEYGIDTAIYIGDGSTGYFRLNPHQYPDNQPVWSPFATITGGCKMLKSVETTPGVKTLLIGATGNNQTLSKRDLTTFADSGTPYTAFFQTGNIPLAHKGTIAKEGFFSGNFVAIGSQPTVSYLNNEISGSFTTFATAVPDPPRLPSASSLFNNRYWFRQGTPAKAVEANSVQIKIAFPAENAANELLDFTINAALDTAANT